MSADPGNASARQRRLVYLAVLLISGAVYLGCIISPPSLMDDVDAVQAQIARNMVSSGDWVTARLDGVAYLEKAPLIYWAIAGAYKIFGATDWAARMVKKTYMTASQLEAEKANLSGDKLSLDQYKEQLEVLIKYTDEVQKKTLETALSKARDDERVGVG